MKPFSLDIVLDYRQRLEDTAKNKLFDARRDKEKVVSKIKHAEATLENAIKDREDLHNKDCGVLELVNAEDKISFISRKIKDLNILLANKQAAVERAHKNLMLRSKEKQVLEKLKEKQNSEWKKYLSKKEAAMLDEIAVLRHSR